MADAETETEDIALSTDELDNVMADAETETEDIALSTDELDNVMADAETETEGIALSTDELDKVADSEEALPENTEDFFDGDDDTPITLSDDEMDVILAEAHVENAMPEKPPVPDSGLDSPIPIDDEISTGNVVEVPTLDSEEKTSELPDTAETVEEAPSLEIEDDEKAGVDDFFNSDVDEPIALSEDELDNILVTAETEEKPDPENSDLSNEMDDTLPEDTELLDENQSIEDQAEQEFHASDSSMYESNQAELSALTEDLDKNPLTTEEDRYQDIIAEDRELESTSAPVESETSQIVSDQEGVVEFDSKSPEAVQDPETEDLKNVMGYLDQLLGELPDDTIKKFANSEYFNLYQKVLDQLGL